MSFSENGKSRESEPKGTQPLGGEPKLHSGVTSGQSSADGYPQQFHPPLSVYGQPRMDSLTEIQRRSDRHYPLQYLDSLRLQEGETSGRSSVGVYEVTRKVTLPELTPEELAQMAPMMERLQQIMTAARQPMLKTLFSRSRPLLFQPVPPMGPLYRSHDCW